MGTALQALNQGLGLLLAGGVKTDAGSASGQLSGASVFVFAVANEKNERHRPSVPRPSKGGGLWAGLGVGLSVRGGFRLGRRLFAGGNFSAAFAAVKIKVHEQASADDEREQIENFVP